MNLNRWPKLVLNALYTANKNSNLNWKWLQSIHNIMCDNNMGFMFKTHLDNSTELFNILRNNQFLRVNVLWYEDACQKSSLADYIQFKRVHFLEDYLLDKLDFYGASLKFKARSNTLALDRKLSTWDKSISGICSLCNEGIEDLKHFMLQCKALNDIRTSEMCNLKNALYDAGFSSVWNIFFSSDLGTQLCFILGSNVPQFMSFPPEESHQSIDSIFDKFCKSFLKKAWTSRASLKNV